jgi:hypothetical protein
MGNLGGTFDKRMNQLGLKKQVDASLIVEDAQKTIIEIFGERGTENLRAISYKKGVLKIASSSSAWAAECQGHGQKLVKKPIEKIIYIVNKNLIQ